jgi:hypothetical protein
MLFHKSYWLNASDETPVIYGFFRGNELYAGIPLTCWQKLYVRVAEKPILTPYSGILFKNQDEKVKYVRKLSVEKEVSQKIASQLKSDFNYVHFGFPPGTVDLQPFIWEGFNSYVMYTYILKLDKSLEEIWGAADSTLRNSITRARKDGITVVPSDDFNQTFNLVEKSYARQNIKMSPKLKSTAFSYNEVLSKRKQCKSFLAKDKNGNYIATTYLIWDKKRSYNLLAGYDPEKGHSGANSLAMWEAIEFSKRELNIEEFDFEGSMIHRIERFIRKFGGQLTVKHHVTWATPALRIPPFIRETSIPDILRNMRIWHAINLGT